MSREFSSVDSRLHYICRGQEFEHRSYHLFNGGITSH
jgi:hypothetical protein